MENKHPLIVFSGGMDSSYMLWKQLEQGDVYTCYIKATQSQEKIAMEMQVRPEIIKFFEKLTGNKVISDTIVDLGCRVDVRENVATTGDLLSNWNNLVPDYMFAQANIWPYALQFATDGNKHSKVCLGYVMGDQFAMHLGDMQLAWNHTSNFARRIHVPMEFPLMYVTKDRILKEIPKELIPFLWICELPVRTDPGDVFCKEFKPCEECPACDTMAKTVFLWERINKKNFNEAVAEAFAQHRANLSNEETDVGQNSHEVDGLRKKESGGCDLEREPDGASQIAHAEEE